MLRAPDMWNRKEIAVFEEKIRIREHNTHTHTQCEFLNCVHDMLVINKRRTDTHTHTTNEGHTQRAKYATQCTNNFSHLYGVAENCEREIETTWRRYKDIYIETIFIYYILVQTDLNRFALENRLVCVCLCVCVHTTNFDDCENTLVYFNNEKKIENVHKAIQEIQRSKNV